MKKRKLNILLILLLCAFIAGVIFLSLNPNRYTSNSNSGDIPVKSNGTYISSALYEADTYIKNNINLSNTNKNIEISTNKFIDNSKLLEKYSKCNGKLIFNSTNKSDSYSYKISTDCNNFNNDLYNVELMKFKLNNNNITDGRMAEVFPVSDGYIILYITDFYYLHLGNYEEDELGRSSNNTLLVKTDENGVLEWATKFGDKLTEGKNKTSEISYEKVYEEDNAYIFLGTIDVNKGSSFEEKYGLGNIEIMQKYSKDGTLLSEQLIPKKISDYNFGNQVIIKGANNLYYDYSGYENFVGFDSNGEIKDEIKIQGFDQRLESLSSVDKFGGYYFDAGDRIYKYNENGNKELEINPAEVLGDDFSGIINSSYIFNNKLLLEISLANVYPSSKRDIIMIYNLDGSFYKSFDYGDVKSKYSSFELKDLVIEGEHIILESKDWEDDNEKLLVDVINKDFNYESRTIYNDIQFTDLFDIKQTYLDDPDTYIPYGDTIIKDNKIIKYFSYGDNIVFCNYINLNEQK